MNQAGEQKPHSFPGVGNSYRVNAGDGNPFAMTYRSDREMAIAWLDGEKKGRVETVNFIPQEIRDGLWLIHWQESDRTTVIHIADLMEGLIHVCIIHPNGTFFQGSSHLEKIA